MEKSNAYRLFLLFIFVIIWVWSAINPVVPEGWLHENFIVFIAVPVLIFLIRYFKLSNISTTCIAIFMTLHVIASHYTYLQVPFGYYLQNLLGAERNMYDRFMHFLFGFLIFYPIREVFIRVTKAKGFWTYYFPVEVVLSMSAFFEILELLVVLFIRPEAAESFMGFQNDFWDTTKDLLNAFIGSLITMFMILIFNLTTYKKTGKEIEKSFVIKNEKVTPEEKRIKKAIKKINENI